MANKKQAFLVLEYYKIVPDKKRDYPGHTWLIR